MRQFCVHLVFGKMLNPLWQFLMILGKFHCCKWPIIEQIMKPPGHSDPRAKQFERQRNLFFLQKMFLSNLPRFAQKNWTSFLKECRSQRSLHLANRTISMSLTGQLNNCQVCCRANLKSFAATPNGRYNSKTFSLHFGLI